MLVVEICKRRIRKEKTFGSANIEDFQTGVHQKLDSRHMGDSIVEEVELECSRE